MIVCEVKIPNVAAAAMAAMAAMQCFQSDQTPFLFPLTGPHLHYFIIWYVLYFILFFIFCDIRILFPLLFYRKSQIIFHPYIRIREKEYQIEYKCSDRENYFV